MAAARSQSNCLDPLPGAGPPSAGMPGGLRHAVSGTSKSAGIPAFQLKGLKRFRQVHPQDLTGLTSGLYAKAHAAGPGECRLWVPHKSRMSQRLPAPIAPKLLRHWSPTLPLQLRNGEHRQVGLPMASSKALRSPGPTAADLDVTSCHMSPHVATCCRVSLRCTGDALSVAAQEISVPVGHACGQSLNPNPRKASRRPGSRALGTWALAEFP